MKDFRVLFLSFLFFISSLVAYPQDVVIKLFPDGIPGEKYNSKYKEKIHAPRRHWGWMTKTTQPEIFVYLPQKEKATGAAVIVCPGGGYRLLAINKEGHEIAKALAERGVAGIVLKYRLPSDEIMLDKTVGPLQDAQEAMRETRRRATEWDIDIDKIGIMGFSAGGHLAALLSTLYNDKVYNDDGTNARPDFAVTVYPVITLDKEYTHKGSRDCLLGINPSDELVERFSNEKNVSPSTPPTFIIHAKDDKTVPLKNSLEYDKVLLENDVKRELYLYEKGGHGFGTNNTKSDASWMDLCISWLKEMGVI